MHRGEGIHTGMEAAKLAAETAVEMFAHGDFSEASTRVYHERWMSAFGYDFKRVIKYDRSRRPDDRYATSSEFFQSKDAFAYNRNRF